MRALQADLEPKLVHFGLSDSIRRCVTIIVDKEGHRASSTISVYWAPPEKRQARGTT